MGQPWPLFNLFSVFSNKHYNFFKTNICDKCPSSIRCWDSNPRPSGCESPPITTRPELPSKTFILFIFNSDHLRHPVLELFLKFFINNVLGLTRILLYFDSFTDMNNSVQLADD